MKISLKGKSIIKKVALALAGVAALTAVGFGVKAIVDYTKNDLKTIHLSYDVGNLGADGKYVADESTLYTKEAFACDGLQIKLDFDNQINYQIFYYDDLDNFIESTEILSEAYSGGVHDSYARLVIIPTNDEDDKIGLIEKVTYPSQMTIKVAKAQNHKYIDVFNKRLRVVDSFGDLRFNYGGFTNSSGEYLFTQSDTWVVTSSDIIAVKGGQSLTWNSSPLTGVGNNKVELSVRELHFTNGSFIVTNGVSENGVYKLSQDTTHLIFIVHMLDSSSSNVKMSGSNLVELRQCFSLSK